MEKIRSGQTFLYKDGGYPSTVMEIRMKDPVEGLSLKRAQETALERYPYFKSRLVLRDGDYYLVANPLPPAFAHTDTLRALGSLETNHHLIDVTWSGKVIRVAFHHGICDGKGILPFVQTLVYYYCTYRYLRVFSAPGVRLAGEPLLPGETAEPFISGPFAVGPGPVPKTSRDGFAIPEAAGPLAGNWRQTVTFPREEFLARCKDYGATPAVMVALMASRALKEVYPQADKPMLCNLASDNRKELGFDHTHRNCVSSIYLPYTEAVAAQPLADQAALYRSMIKEQKHPDAVRTVNNGNKVLCDRLDQLEGYEAKKQMMSFLGAFCVNTFVLSYLGQLGIGDCEQHVESMHFYNSGSRGLILNMVSAGDHVSVDVLQSYESERFTQAFQHVAHGLGFGCTVSALQAFANPSHEILENPQHSPVLVTPAQDALVS